jgi:hypothetical protein
MCDFYLAAPGDGKVRAGSRNTTMPLLATFWIGPWETLSRPVVVQPELSGRFDFTLEFEWTPRSDALSGPDHECPGRVAGADAFGGRARAATAIMPRSFPLDTMESAVDYGYVAVGDGKYLLPVHLDGS